MLSCFRYSALSLTCIAGFSALEMHLLLLFCTHSQKCICDPTAQKPSHWCRVRRERGAITMHQSKTDFYFIFKNFKSGASMAFLSNNFTFQCQMWCFVTFSLLWTVIVLLYVQSNCHKPIFQGGTLDSSQSECSLTVEQLAELDNDGITDIMVIIKMRYIYIWLIDITRCHHLSEVYMTQWHHSLSSLKWGVYIYIYLIPLQANSRYFSSQNFS